MAQVFVSQLGPHPFYMLIRRYEEVVDPEPIAAVAWCFEHADAMNTVPFADGGCQHKPRRLAHA